MLFLLRPRQTWIPCPRFRARCRSKTCTASSCRRRTRRPRRVAPAGGRHPTPVALLEGARDSSTSPGRSPTRTQGREGPAARPRRDMTSNADRGTILGRACARSVSRATATRSARCTRTTCGCGRRPCRRRQWTSFSSKFDGQNDTFCPTSRSKSRRSTSSSGGPACAEWIVSMTHSGPLEVAEGRVVDATGDAGGAQRCHRRRVQWRPHLLTPSILGRVRHLRSARLRAGRTARHDDDGSLRLR